MKKTSIFLLPIILLILCLSGCRSKNDGMKDGFYTAEMSEYSHGWKEYLCIMVKNNAIVYAEFNAKNKGGYIKAWDNAYMQTMLHSNGTYPNEYTRDYASQLLEGQGNSSIDAISGASSSHASFVKLAEAVLEQARKGDSSIVVVDTSK